MMRTALAAATLALAAMPALAQQTTSLAPGALLRALDKVSGQITDIEMKTGDTQNFGRLTIHLNECRFPEGNRAGDAFAGLEIRDVTANEAVFEGWMIASAPALSALDHAQYDVWVIRCITS
ncbi:MAG: DUF2155 domain-containing protein [Aliishimia sp.]